MPTTTESRSCGPRPPDGGGALLAEFAGLGVTAYQAAQAFAALAWPEPRKARIPVGEWRLGGYSGTFRLVGGAAEYRLECSGRDGVWRVYRVTEGDHAG